MERQTKNYKCLNIIATIGHFLSGITMAALLSGKNSVVIPYTESYSEWINVNNGTCQLGYRSFETSDGNYCIGTTTKPVDCNNDSCYGINLGWLIISFHMLFFIHWSLRVYIYIYI